MKNNSTLIKKINEELMNRNADFNIKSDIIEKNNQSLEAWCLKGNSMANPVIYPTEYLMEMPFEWLVEHLMKIYEENKLNINLECIDEDYIYQNVIPQVVGKDTNDKMLKDLYYEEYLDMAIVYRVPLSSESSFLLTTQFLCNFELNTDTLKKCAFENSKNTYTFKNLYSMISDYVSEDTLNPDHTLYVVSNLSNVYGAAAIINPFILDDCRRRLESDFYILPSSTDEIILLRDSNDIDILSLKQMVCDVNQTECAPNKVLTNSIYYYSANGLEKVA